MFSGVSFFAGKKNCGVVASSGGDMLVFLVNLLAWRSGKGLVLPPTGAPDPNTNELTCKKSAVCLSLTLLCCETEKRGTKQTRGGQEAVGMCVGLGLSQGMESTKATHDLGHSSNCQLSTL